MKLDLDRSTASIVSESLTDRVPVGHKNLWPLSTGFVMADTYEPRITVVELIQSPPAAHTFVVRTAEINHVLSTMNRKRPENPFGDVVFNAITADSDDRIYVSVTGQRLAEGAAIVQLQRDGTVTRTLRPQLPLISGTRPGIMLPSSIACTTSQLFICNGDGKVAVYPLK